MPKIKQNLTNDKVLLWFYWIHRETKNIDWISEDFPCLPQTKSFTDADLHINYQLPYSSILHLSLRVDSWDFHFKNIWFQKNFFKTNFLERVNLTTSLLKDWTFNTFSHSLCCMNGVGGYFLYLYTHILRITVIKHF